MLLSWTHTFSVLSLQLEQLRRHNGPAIIHRAIKCQSRSWSKRGTEVNGSHHGDKRLVKSTQGSKPQWHPSQNQPPDSTGNLLSSRRQRIGSRTIVRSPSLTRHKWRELVSSGRLVCTCHEVFLGCYLCFGLLLFRLYAFIEAAALRSIALRYAGALIAIVRVFFFFSFRLLLILRCRFFRVFCTIRCRFLFVWRVRRTFFPSGWCFPAL